jgi:hypothetical protein
MLTSDFHYLRLDIFSLKLDNECICTVDNAILNHAKMTNGRKGGRWGGGAFWGGGGLKAISRPPSPSHEIESSSSLGWNIGEGVSKYGDRSVYTNMGIGVYTHLWG